jgi:RHS repeat-associated protein
MRHRFLVPLIAVSVSLALLAGACSSSDSNNRSAIGGSVGDPTSLPALPLQEGSGERVPLSFGAVITPSSWISTSLSPTLSVPGGTGAWTFEISDLSGGTSAFGTKVYAESGASARIPLGAGLKQGHVYTWIARNSSGSQVPVSGSFQMDVQQSAAQQFDSLGALNVGLSSGEASFVWSSHSVSSLPGTIGFGLQFQTSNREQIGMPAGWSMQAASSSPYRRVILREDGSLALEALNGTITTYSEGPGGALLPVRIGSGVSVDTTGLAPVLVRNPDGTFAVLTKDATSIFTVDESTASAYLSDVSSTDHPMLSQKWTKGRLQSITDPVSGRDVTFTYGGGNCPSPASGFMEAPEGLLCQVKFWDGSTSSLMYVETPLGPSIGRILDWPEAKGNGAQVTDIAYDQVGRIAATRSPLVARAAAADIVPADDSAFWSRLTYFEDGRVSSFTESAPQPGAKRCARSYGYNGSTTQIFDECLGKMILEVLFDPTTFFPLRTTNVLGKTSTNEWDLAAGQLLSSVDYQQRATLYRYENGNMVASTGPTRGSLAAAQTTLFEYDQKFDASLQPTPMRGLDVTYFPDASETTADGLQELGPMIDGVLVPSLAVNWETAPVGDGGWSAIMTGVVSVKTSGDYRIVSGNSTARVTVNNVACVDTGCDALPLEAGANSIRIDVSSPESASSIDIAWAGPDSGGVLQAIPTSALSPQYGLTTTTKAIDPTAKRSPAQTESRSIYTNPSNGQLSARVNQSGSRTSLDYESGSGGQGGWSRQTATTGADGATYSFTYWGDRESAKSSCPGATSANQGGAAKAVLSPGPDGVPKATSTRWVDAGGRIVATALAGGVVTCNTFGPASQLLKSELRNTGSPWSVSFDYAVDGNPLVSTTTEVHGDKTSISRTEVDLHGRAIRSVDRFGVETRVVYDTRVGGVATSTVIAPGAAPTVLSGAYNEAGQLISLSLDGRVLATVDINAESAIERVVYANGQSMTQTFNDALTLTGRVWSGVAGEFSNSRDISAGGNLSAETLTGPTGSSTFSYTHDEVGRLSNASVTRGLVPFDRSWSWTFDQASNRLTQRITDDGAVVGDYTYTYNKGAQLTGTTDPAAKDGIEYDEYGNAIKVGPDTFTYDAGHRLVAATDGDIEVTYELDITGSPISKTTTGGSSAGTVVYASSGVILDASLKPTAQLFVLPGGVQYTKSFGSLTTSEWKFLTIGGNEFFTTDDAGTLVGTAQVFDPYGQRLTVSEPVQPGLPSMTWQADTGNETESLKTSYQLMGVRPYVPALGRFLQPDPKVGGSANQYDYASQDPVNLSDPSGEDVSDWVAPLATAVATVGAVFLFRITSVKMGLVVGGLIGAAGAVVSAGIDAANNNLSTWTAVRAGYTILAGLAAGGGAVAARNKWVSSAKAKQVKPVPEDPASAPSAPPDIENVTAPPEYTVPAARIEYEVTYMKTWAAAETRWIEKQGGWAGGRRHPIINSEFSRLARRAATAAADKLDPGVMAAKKAQASLAFDAKIAMYRREFGIDQ